MNVNLLTLIDSLGNDLFPVEEPNILAMFVIACGIAIFGFIGYTKRDING